ncbi:MAG: hypothetical protein ACKPKO_05625, partial [Candidatus Fonsibacter sp.]
MQSVSPEEIRSAFLLAVARDITEGAPPSVLVEWMKLSLSCTTTFVLDTTPRIGSSEHINCAKTWR